jgi:hypothetical protein
MEQAARNDGFVPGRSVQQICGFRLRSNLPLEDSNYDLDDTHRG